MMATPLPGGVEGLPMLSRLQARFDALEARRRELIAELSDLDETQLTFRPKPGAWSLLQVARHLLLVEEVMAAQRLKGEGTRRRNLRQRVGKALVWLVMKTGFRVRIPTERVSPEARPDLRETDERWERTRAGLRARLLGLTAEEAHRVFARHPVAGPLDAAESLNFLVMHFDHHLRQVRRIRSAPGFPGRA